MHVEKRGKDELEIPKEEDMDLQWESDLGLLDIRLRNTDYRQHVTRDLVAP